MSDPEKGFWLTEQARAIGERIERTGVTETTNLVVGGHKGYAIIHIASLGEPREVSEAAITVAKAQIDAEENTEPGARLH